MTNNIIVNEGLFDRSADHQIDKSFYDMCEKMIDSVDKAISDTPQAGLLFKNKTLKDAKSYSKSIEKAKQKIEKGKKNNIAKISISINLTRSGLRSEKMMSLLNKALSGFGFKSTKPFDSFMKNMFTGSYLYRAEKDGTYTILGYNVTYMTNYNIECGLQDASIEIANLPDTEKTRKKLNLENAILVEEGCVFDKDAIIELFGESLIRTDLGIFSECTFLENDLSRAVNDLYKAQKNFHDNHKARMDELNKTLSKINGNDGKDSKEHDKIKEMQDKNQKDLDDLLSSF